MNSDPVVVNGDKVINLKKRRVPEPRRSFRGYGITLGDVEGHLVAVISPTPERAAQWARHMFPGLEVDETKIQEVVIFNADAAQEES